jgi:hypothetical protein
MFLQRNLRYRNILSVDELNEKYYFTGADKYTTDGKCPKKPERRL